MTQKKEFFISHHELAKVLIKDRGIHSGHWGVTVRFAMHATNVPTKLNDEETVLPAAILPVVEIGLKCWDEPNKLTVDAATVNPAARPAKKEKSESAKKKPRRRI